MASWVEDLRGLLGALEMAQAYLLGISMGGMIAMAFAVQYPHMAKALILANTSSRLSDQGLSLLNARAEMVEQYGMESILEASMAGSLSAGFIQSNEEIVGRERETIRRNDPQAFAATCRAIASVDLTSDLGRIACPTLIIAGEEDAAIPLDSVQALHRQIPLSHLKVLPHCGHLSHIEQPEAFNAAVLEFLAPLQG